MAVVTPTMALAAISSCFAVVAGAQVNYDPEKCQCEKLCGTLLRGLLTGLSIDGPALMQGTKCGDCLPQ